MVLTTANKETESCVQVGPVTMTAGNW